VTSERFGRVNRREEREFPGEDPAWAQAGSVGEVKGARRREREGGGDSIEGRPPGGKKQKQKLARGTQKKKKTAKEHKDVRTARAETRKKP
jgi:hypothetical protein